MTTASPPLSPTTLNPPLKWRARSSSSSRSSAYTRDQLEQHFGNPHDGTLTGSVDDPQRISRILIFDNQHPSFPPEIFIKSNLHLVFGTPLETLRVIPIPLFRQTPWGSSPSSSGSPSTKDRWEFAGWYVVDNVQRIERRSPELCTRLEAKWGAKKGRAGQRTPEAWNRSLDVDWALISLRRVSDLDCPLECPNSTAATIGTFGEEGGVDLEYGAGHSNGHSFAKRAFSIDDGAPEDYSPAPPPPTRRSTAAGLASHHVDEYFIPPPPPPPSRVPTMGTKTNVFEDEGLDCKLMDESIVSISRQSEESMSESEYGNVTRSEIEDCDRWSELSTGPVDRQWTVVYEEKDELV